MQRLTGIVLIGVGIAGVLLQATLGLNLLINDALQNTLGDSATQTYGSAIGEGVVYLLFYFIAAAGLAFLAVSGRPS